MESKLLPPEKRAVKLGIGPNGELVLDATFYETGGWLENMLVRFSEFSETVACMDDLEKIVTAKFAELDKRDATKANE